ncbi:MAG: O-antigen/teichoic acid export membrane protein [Planctomycetota bacterium]
MNEDQKEAESRAAADATVAEQTGPPGAIPRRVWGGTGLLVVGRIFGSTCTLIALYVLANHLSGEDFGRYTFYLALFMVLDSLVDLGTGQAAVQLTSRDPDRLTSVLRTAKRVRLVTGAIGVLLMGGGALLAGESGAWWLLLASLYPITHVFELSTVVFKNRIAWSRPVMVRMSASAASLAFVLLLWMQSVEEPALYVLAVACGSTLGNFGLRLVARRHLPQGTAPAAPLRPFLALALPMGIAGLCQQVYFYIDNLFVRPIEGEEALGHYNLAVRVMSYSIMVAVYAPLAALPWLSREHAAERLGAAVGKIALPLVSLAAIGAGFVWPWSEDLLGLFGAEFQAAAGSLRWLLLAVVAIYLGSPLLTGVVAAGRSKAVLASALVGMLVNVIGNAWLVPLYGIDGAAIATCATEVSVALTAGAALARANAWPLQRAMLPFWLATPALFWLARILSGSVKNMVLGS